ncbi:MAG: HAMP domain-containing protein [Chitinophagales bacterium]|nr:HAMP domain-containing protein [Chitinophagales bacterium]
MSTQLKATVLLFVSLFSLIVLISGFVYLSVSNYAYDDFYKLLEIRALTYAKIEIEKDTSSYARQMAEIKNEYFEKLPLEQVVAISAEPGKSFAGYADRMKLPPSFFNEIIAKGKAEYNNSSLFYKGIYYKSGATPYIIIASAQNYFETHHKAYLKKTLILAVALTFLLAFFISYFFSRSVFNPITKITERVKQISSENLHLRLPEQSKGDELGTLTRTFNDMLDRIETSFETQNNFISNASHELRTPLTAIIGEGDVALAKLRTSEEYIDTIKVMLEEAEKLEKKTKALLFLAQTGFNGKIQKFEKVRIDQLLWDVKDTIEKINPQSKIHIDTTMLPENPRKLKVRGNEQLLHLAFTNIIMNACKYSNYQTVDISIGASDTKVFIAIKDTGIGIPPNEVKYIYDPFFRASNTNNYEGYGIGLPLTQNIIRIHGGEIHVSSIENKGTTVQINLPVGEFDF